jgi:AraC family transcriptional activator of pobA
VAGTRGNQNHAIPVVDFYGDAESWPTSELIHSEPLGERSRLHDWRIRPHRHSHLTQLFLLQKGRGVARLDSIEHDVVAPCILLIPEHCIHDFAWDKGCRGYVLSITTFLTRSLEKQVGAYAAIFREPATIKPTNDSNYVQSLFEGIHKEFTDSRALKEMSLECRLGELTVWLARSKPRQTEFATRPTRAKKHYLRFTNLVDSHHKSQWPVKTYADAVGITSSHLNAICRQLSGRSALQVIHERLVLTARRDLVYTENTIANVAYKLGFADPSYFTRFFRRETGISPSAFRRQSGTYSPGSSTQ